MKGALALDSLIIFKNYTVHMGFALENHDYRLVN